MNCIIAKASHSSCNEANHPIFQLLCFILVVSLLFLSIPVDFAWTVRHPDTATEKYVLVTEGFLQRQVALFVLGLLGLVSICPKIGSTVRIRGSLGWLIVVFFCWVLLSSIWSENLDLMLRRSVALILISIAALAFAERFSLRSIIKFAFFACGLILLMSLASEILLSTFHPLDKGYRFAGLMHSNSQGQNCAVLIITLLVSARLTKMKPYLYLLATVVVLIFLIMTKSRTAIGSAFVCVTMYYALTAQRKGWAVLLFTAAISGILAIIILLGSDLTTHIESVISIGRTNSNLYTFQGRVDAWNELIYYFYKHPLIGYGYGSFWTPDRLFSLAESRGLASAHSAYLEVALALGIVGLIIYILIFLMAVKTSIVRYAHSGAVEYAFVFGILLLFSLNSLLESAVPLSQIPLFLCLIILSKLGFVYKTF